MQTLKIIFAGTPEFAAEHLHAIITNSAHQICAVYTQPDRPKGRGKRLSPSPVKTLALEHQIDVLQPTSLKEASTQEQLKAYQADLMVVVAYGLILPKPVLIAPRLGCINVHASLLPRWRGAAPIERAIQAGDLETGITLMQMDEGLDDGDILLKSSLPIDNKVIGDELREQLSTLGCALLLEGLEQLANNSLLAGSEQDESKVSYAHKLNKQEAQINWQDSAENILLKVRAFNSQNICYTHIDQHRIRIWQAQVVSPPNTQLNKQTKDGTILRVGKEGIDVACRNSTLRIQIMQLPGGKALAVKDILNSRADWFTVGEVFS